MKLCKTIYTRKSIRKYKKEKLSDDEILKINNFILDIKPLYPNINFKIEFIDKENIKCILPWVTPQVIAFFSEEKEGYLENAGFILQQLDLFLQSNKIGTCYLGMASLDIQVKKRHDDNLKYVMMLSFGYPKNEKFRNDISEFKRKELSKISDVEDNKLEVARLAPSSVNSQPWYFIHQDHIIHTYCLKRGVLKKVLIDMNQIDVGIALAHLYIANPNTFNFFKLDNIKPIKDSIYIGSFTI